MVILIKHSLQFQYNIIHNMYTSMYIVTVKSNVLQF